METVECRYRGQVIGWLIGGPNGCRYRKATVLTDQQKAHMRAMQNDPGAWKGSRNGQADYVVNPFSAYPFI